MPADRAPGDLPVLFLCNLEPEWNSRDAAEVRAANGMMAAALEEAGHPVVAGELRDSDLAALLATHAPAGTVVFNQCESLPGIPRSEHAVARIIEDMGFAFTGSDARALELAGDKAGIKRLLAANGIPTPAWRIYHTPSAGDWTIFPAIVKAARDHCSLGITSESVVLSRGELEARIAYILDHLGQPALVEDFIDGREFHVPMWGNGEIKMLPVVEMDFSAFGDVHERLCTYDSKFNPASRHYTGIGTLIPAPLGEDEMGRLEHVCRKAYLVAGCRDYARIDVRKRGGEFLVLDVNPNADLDSEASIACAAAHTGIAYPQMLGFLVRLAASRLAP